MNTEQSTSAEIDSVVESVRLGDQDARRSLLAGHHAYLRQVIDLRMDDALRVRVDPSDIVQEALLEAVRRVSDYARDPQIPLRLWMRRIAIDRLNMAHRRHVAAEKRSVRRLVAVPEQSSMSIAAQLVAAISSPSMKAGRAEVTGKVRDAISRLDDNDQEIILLQAFEGLNSTESAQVLGIEPATARKRFGRALLRLRTLLIEGGLGESQA